MLRHHVMPRDSLGQVISNMESNADDLSHFTDLSIYNYRIRLECIQVPRYDIQMKALRASTCHQMVV